MVLTYSCILVNILLIDRQFSVVNCCSTCQKMDVVHPSVLEDSHHDFTCRMCLLNMFCVGNLCASISVMLSFFVGWIGMPRFSPSINHVLWLNSVENVFTHDLPSILLVHAQHLWYTSDKHFFLIQCAYEQLFLYRSIICSILVRIQVLTW